MQARDGPAEAASQSDGKHAEPGHKCSALAEWCALPYILHPLLVSALTSFILLQDIQSCQLRRKASVQWPPLQRWAARRSRLRTSGTWRLVHIL